MSYQKTREKSFLQLIILYIFAHASQNNMSEKMGKYIFALRQ